MDIRNFFQKPKDGGTNSKKSTTEDDKSKKKRIVVSDSDEEVEMKPVVKAESKPKVKAPEPKETKVAQEVDPAAFFGAKKVHQSEETHVKKVKAPPKPAKPVINLDDDFMDDDDIDLGQIDDTMLDVNNYLDPEEREMYLSQSQPSASQPQPSQSPMTKKEQTPVKQPASPIVIASSSNPASTKKRKLEIDLTLDDEEDDNSTSVSATTTTATTTKTKTPTKKPKSSAETSPVEKEPKKRKTQAGGSKKASPVSAKKEDKKPAADDTPTSSAPAEKKKFNYGQLLARKPSAPGSKEIPVGAENCLHGLAFVFTGELSSIDRVQSKDLVLRYGGVVRTAVSGKTNYLVEGDECGESKRKKAQTLGVKIIGEDEFYDLIRTLPGKDAEGKLLPVSASAAPAASSSKAAAAPATTTTSTSSAVTPKPATTSQSFGGSSSSSSSSSLARPLPPAQPARPKTGASSADAGQLWTVKYAPKTLSEYVGQNANVKRLKDFLLTWDPQSGGTVQEAGGKGKGKDGPSVYRAALLSGAPGVGKTTAAHLVAKDCGYEVLEMNASDTRSKNSLKALVSQLVGNHSVTEYFVTDAVKQKSSALAKGKKTVLVMDEVDGMSAGDRGGMAELITIIKKSKIPIICICNDRQSQKVRSLANHCLDLRFHKAQAPAISKRMEEIARKEGITIAPNSLLSLVTSTNADLRQILNLLQTFSLRQNHLTYDEGSRLAKVSEKDMTINIFEIMTRVLDGINFRKYSFFDKLDYYYFDYSLVPLLIQENYLKNVPAIAMELSQGNDKLLAAKTMELLSSAADAISEGDLVDRMIFRNNNWSLMPTHAITSFVRPAFFAHGRAWQGNAAFGAYGFPSYLGKNSTLGKNVRLLREMQAHMHLNISADKNEVRQSYLPTLAKVLTQPLIAEGASAVNDVIRVMDDYYLTREDYDTLFELALKPDTFIGKIPTAAKSAFTRTYNKASHPTHHIAVIGAKAAKKGSGVDRSAKPDFEDAIDDDVEYVDDEDDDTASESGSVVAPVAPKKAPAKSKAGGSGSGGSSSKGKGKGKAKA